MLSIKLQHFAFVAFADIPFHRRLRHFRGVEPWQSPIQLPAKRAPDRRAGWMFQRRARAVRLLHILDGPQGHSDKTGVRRTMPGLNAGHALSIPWAIQMKAISIEEPAHLVKTLTGAILGCGGWVLSRGANDTGSVNMLFEFERQACVEIYSVMIASGLDLSQSGHIRFTELCQCTRSHMEDCGAEIASIDLEIQTFPVEMLHRSLANETA